jgi:2C-methyl-D-erythritol 2,4-cyclodiphosphate synthase
MTFIKAEQVVIREDKGRIATMYHHDATTPRPIASYEQEIRYLKMQLAAKETEIEQKNFEIEECNEIITKQTRTINWQARAINHDIKEIISLSEENQELKRKLEEQQHGKSKNVL